MSEKVGAVDIEGVTPSWLSQALGYPVRSVAAKRVGTGQTGATYRLTLDVDQGPKTLIAKVGNGPPEARLRVATGFVGEVGFYARLRSSLDVRAPQCWYAAHSDDKVTYTLLLEDLAPRVPGVQAEGVEVERARGAIRNLAGLHVPRWNDASLFEYEFLTSTRDPDRASFLGKLTRSAAVKFIELYRDALSAADVETLQQSTEVFESWAKSANTHFALLHGDYRLDNLMFGEDPDDVVALDWQTMVIGPPTRDLAYFLGTCLEIEERRRSERSLVDFYYQELTRRGVQGYSAEACFRDYCIGHVQAVLITTVGCVFATGERSAGSDGMFLAMARRSCAAIRDLQTLEQLAP